MFILLNLFSENCRPFRLESGKSFLEIETVESHLQGSRRTILDVVVDQHLINAFPDI